MDMQRLLDATLPGLGYELVDLELARDGLVRIFIDKPGGITLDDCVAVSNHLTRLFTVENIPYERLEVSSPGLDRPLKKEADFVRFAGERVKIKLRLPIDGKKTVQGELRGVVEGAVQVAVDAERVVAVPLAQIDKARLVPVF
ncbi:ribosome maturation factor RimP [Chitinimonas koreensis]|uniref:ribosome maturation factor RimP n=1 Tax=Chitinimonas koreensis TaxID=356302 RepID=UPI00048D569B|nr:ribosome maturation factor RimP [Chitinimonas koreensis]QNM97278.1 ribosome maturation factor RimP [Chitinimonas koreensis]